MRLYLVGYMCCGKTTVGRLLANKLQGEFVDLDNAIEQRYHAYIPFIFSTYGEEAFRKLEAAVLRSLPFPQSGFQIVSCGGGTPCFQNNMDYIRETGLSVYLHLSPDDIYARLQSSRRQRPLFASVPPDERLQYITNQLSIREQYYSQATHFLDIANIDVNDIVDMIASLVDANS